jgi:hypothetical protein
MTLERAFELINNLDEVEARRRFLPRWSTVVVDRTGTVIDVIRHREWPNEQIQRAHMEMYPESVQFTASVGMYATLDELRSKIEDCIAAHMDY